MEKCLHFRPAEPRDAPLLAALRNDPETLLCLHDVNQYSAAHTERWLAELPANTRRYVVWEEVRGEQPGDREQPDQVRDGRHAAMAGQASTAATRHFVGVVRVDRIDWVNRNCMVGLDLVPEFRGRGYAHRVYDWLLEYLFAHCNMHMVYLEVLESNMRARRLYERLGFHMDGVLREKVFRHGRYESSILMSLLAAEYAARREAS